MRRRLVGFARLARCALGGFGHEFAGALGTAHERCGGLGHALVRHFDHLAKRALDGGAALKVEHRRKHVADAWNHVGHGALHDGVRVLRNDLGGLEVGRCGARASKVRTHSLKGLDALADACGLALGWRKEALGGLL